MKVIKAFIHQHRAAAVVHALKDAGCRNLCVAHTGTIGACTVEQPAVVK